VNDLQVDCTTPPGQIWVQRHQSAMLSFNIPSQEEIQNKVIEAFNIHSCKFQITDAIAQLQRKKVVTISPTSSRKTLTFWIPLLFKDDGIIIVTTALNILGAQNVIELAKLGLPAVNITGETQHHDYLRCVLTFIIHALLTNVSCKDIGKCLFRVIVISPKKILNDNWFIDFWANKKFAYRLFSISIDEAQCIDLWGNEFHADYAVLAKL
jgi:superfamily II DNA helicase RecQ